MSSVEVPTHVIRMLAERVEQVSREQALAALGERYAEQLSRISHDLRHLLPGSCPNCQHQDGQHTGYCQALSTEVEGDLCGCPITREALDVVRRLVMAAREGAV